MRPASNGCWVSPGGWPAPRPRRPESTRTPEAAATAETGTDAAAAAIDAALSDPSAEAGLNRLATQFGPRYPVDLASILVCVYPPGMLGALRAFGDPALTGMPVGFYQALARNPVAQLLVNRFGGRFLLHLVNLRPERTPALRLSRSAPDIERVWLGLTLRYGRTEQQIAELAARTGGLPPSAAWTRCSGLGQSRGR